MGPLPLHVAASGEPIPALHGHRSEGPDMRHAPSIPNMLDELEHFVRDEDVVGYTERFRALLDTIGVNVSVAIERDGTECLMVGSRCDSQIRHRSRWIHFLFEHFDRDEQRRSYLIRQLRREGWFTDDRPSNPRQTTAAIRDFLKFEGRILLDPQGHLGEGGGIPRAMLEGNADEVAACRQACRAYFDIRRRWSADRQIERVVRMLGRQIDNGWIVLEAQA
ncbi:hypothetical protein [Sphingomonas sp. J315]|uniref:hypothetical protein n=2 Tax=unclassified Sphingomonas TaxID=196159 RepID=UPI0021ADCCEE|nr:hypothetical protein [Sphingomonas sp. J315]UUY00772.1 hypothetical protein LRS08_06760 [Sphingomonas sp. J315]